MRVVSLAELDAIPVGERGLLWRPLRHTLGIEAFGINAYTAREVGGEVVEEHDELQGGAGRHEELYVVVAGRARFTVGEQTVEAAAGTCVYVDDPALRRGAVAEEPETTVLAVGGAPGTPFAVSAWEFNFRAADAARRGDVPAAVAIAREGLERHPHNATVLYNLACIEALAGETDAALAHLRLSIERDARLREHAGRDTDLDSLRPVPGFPA